jgi:hypothetical protein
MGTVKLNTYYSNIGDRLIACEGGSETIYLTDRKRKVNVTFCRDCPIVKSGRCCQVFLFDLFRFLRQEDYDE